MTTPGRSSSTAQRRAATVASKKSMRRAAPAGPAAPAPAAPRAAKRTEANDVVGALLAEHRYAARLLDVLEQQLAAVSHGRPLDREAVLGVMSYMTQYPDTYHHPREDAMFARLAKRDPALKQRIAEIERGHRAIGSAGRELLAAVQREPVRGARKPATASRIADYVAAMRQHMAIEERELFPRARQLLDEQDLAAIDRDFSRVADPIFEASVRDAYAAYPPLVRMLVEQPALRQVLDVLDGLYESASTLGELLFAGTTAAAPTVRQTERKQVAREID